MSKEATEALLKHHGVKGMRWGVRKEKIKGGLRKVGKAIDSVATAVADSHWEKSVYKVDTWVAIHNKVADDMNGEHGSLAKLNDSPKYRGKNLLTDKKLEAEYHQDFAKMSDSLWKKHTNEVVGTNYSGTKKGLFVNDAYGPRIVIRDMQGKKIAQSATSTSSDIIFRFKMDSSGKFVEMNTATLDSIKQGEDFVADHISHHGVKGMKWGVRQKTPTVTVTDKKRKLKSTGGQGLPAHKDAINAQVHRQKLKKSGTKALSNQELQELATRMNLEQQVSRLQKGQPQSNGKKFVSKFLAKAAKEHLPKLAKAAAAQQVAKAMESSANKKEQK